MTDTQRRAAAKQFAADWQGKGYEKGHSQTFWLSLLQKVYGVEEPDKFITFEDQIMLDHTSFIDGFIPSTHVLIEQKVIDVELGKVAGDDPPGSLGVGQFGGIPFGLLERGQQGAVRLLDGLVQLFAQAFLLNQDVGGGDKAVDEAGVIQHG